MAEDAAALCGPHYGVGTDGSAPSLGTGRRGAGGAADPQPGASFGAVGAGCVGDNPGGDGRSARLAALETLEATAASEKFYLDMNFDAGDIQFINNRLLIQGRTGYEDRADVRDRRHRPRAHRCRSTRWPSRMRIPAGVP